MGHRFFQTIRQWCHFNQAFDKSWAETGGRTGVRGAPVVVGVGLIEWLAAGRAPHTWCPFGETEESRCAPRDAGSRHPAMEVGQGKPCREDLR